MLRLVGWMRSVALVASAWLLLRGTVGVFHGDNVGPLLAGGTFTAGASFFDDDVADYIADPDHGFGKSLEDVATPRTRSPWPRSSSATTAGDLRDVVALDHVAEEQEPPGRSPRVHQ